MAKRTAADFLAIAFAAATVIFLLCGSFCQVKRPRLTVCPIAPADPRQPSIEGSGFASNAVYPATRPADIAGPIKLYGSWLNSNESVGAVHSRWYVPVRQFSILVAGHPHHPGIQLFAEWTDGATTERLLLLPPNDPGKMWVLQPIHLPAYRQIRRFRLVAEDASRSHAGWIGFSEPFIITANDEKKILKQVLLIILTTLTAFVLLLGPGLVLRYLMHSRGRAASPIWLPVPGLVLLACLGLLIWKGPYLLSSYATARLALWPLALYLFAFSLRVPLSKLINSIERRVLLVVLLLASIAVGKSIYSIGPPGELYGNSISRTLEVGDRSDSRISFHMVQIVAARKGAFSGFAAQLFSPWNFSHRGPIAGLAASPLVLAGPVHVPEELPEQPWTVLDPEGFSAYRIAMIVMASCMLLTVFGLARIFVSEQWAFVVFLGTVTAPFVIHEIYFTWPKIVASGFVLLTVYLIIRSRPLMAGFALGLGYLSHPSALVWTPALLVVSALTTPSSLQSRAAKFKIWIQRSAALLVGLVVWLLLWRVINKSNYEQNGFLAYFASTGGLLPSVSNWILSRWESTLNTLVPLHLYLFDRNQPNVNQIGGTSPALVQFFFQDWNTLPFGVGIGFYFYLLLLFYRVWPKAKHWLLWVFAPSLLLFIVYIGVSVTGVLREGLHAWLFGLLCFALISSQEEISQSTLLVQLLKAVMLLRATEVMAMLLLPAIGTQHAVFREQFALTDTFALVLMIGGTAWIYYTLYEAISFPADNQELLSQKTPDGWQFQV